MDVIVISGCSTISVSRMQLRRATGGCLEGITRAKEGLLTRFSAILTEKEIRGFEIAQETYHFDKFDQLCTQFASTLFSILITLHHMTSSQCDATVHWKLVESVHGTNIAREIV